MLGPTSRAFGEPMPYTFGGKEIVVYGRLQEVYPKIEAEYYRRHPNPLRTYRESVDAGLFPGAEERSEFLRLSVAEANRIQDASGRDILDWIGTIDGEAFYGSLCLRWPPKDGGTLEDSPRLTEKEVKDLIVAEMEIVIRKRLAKAEDAERMAEEAENSVLAKLHEAISMASGTDLLGKEIGPSSGADSAGESEAKTISP